MKCTFTVIAFSLSVVLVQSCATTDKIISAVKKSTACTPVYGNWCGPGYPSDGNNPRPVDVWDRACRAHDKCYEARGHYSKSCDKEFLSRLRKLQNRYRLPLPSAMQNAESWFTEDNHLKINLGLGDMVAFFNDCTGGEGVAEEVCVTPSRSCSKAHAVYLLLPARGGANCACRFRNGRVAYGTWKPYPNSLP